VTQRVAVVVLVDMIGAVFKSAIGHHISQDQSLDSLCTHSEMAGVLYWLAIWTNGYLQWTQRTFSDTSNPHRLIRSDRLATLNETKQLQDVMIDAQYISIFKFVANHLNDEISDLERNSEKDTPSVLFYLASTFVWELLSRPSARDALKNKDSSFGQGLGYLLEALLPYRTRTSGRKNDLLEKRFVHADNAYPYGRRIERFSEIWWEQHFEHGRGIILKDAEQGTHFLSVYIQQIKCHNQPLEPAVTGGSDSNSSPSSSSQDERSIADVVNMPTAMSLPSASPGVVDNSPTSNTPVPYGNIFDLNEVAYADLQPLPLTRAGSTSDDHDENTERQSFSDSPAIPSPVMVANETPDPVANPTLKYSRPSSVDLDASHPPDGNYAANRATIQIPSSSAPLPSGEVNTGPPDANVVGDEEAHIQAGKPHLAIEVGSPTGMERSEVVEGADSGDGAPEGHQARLEDAVVRIESDSPNEAARSRREGAGCVRSMATDPGL
jgi:hypothetical protein